MGKELVVGFLFDNDGVLIDSTELHWRSWQLLMNEDPSFHMTHEEFVKGFGKRNDLILKELFPNHPEKQLVKWAERKENLFREIARGNVELLPGMEAFLKKLEEKKTPRIIASSTPLENLKMYIQTTVLGQYFEHFVSAEEVAHGKPAPDIFIAAAGHLGLPPCRCIVLEDAPAGIAAGKKAGCFVVALETTHKASELKDYDLIYPSARDLDLKEILTCFKFWSEIAEIPKKSWWRYFFGSLLIILGCIGLLFPVAPGFLLLIGGLYLINKKWLRQKQLAFRKYLLERRRKKKSS